MTAPLDLACSPMGRTVLDGILLGIGGIVVTLALLAVPYALVMVFGERR